MSLDPQPPSNLARLIARDIVSVGRVPAILLILILMSALAVVYVTHQSRQMIAQQEQLFIERDQLDIEWRNQILEENSLAEHSRVERFAEEEIDMKRPSAKNEIVVQ
ncbi:MULTISPECIES: cell division protein FtsL [Photobacterium]|jgi:cell division protein FtsL|uniref:Cell division protein FtsL n=2 Tax=Photobacterium TaxID=657 RepID=A0A2T3JDW8_9GAMM|nr:MULTISPECIES: cell division protein FtsL [Photobacterium]PSU47062.1 cell division protein FtsL [Photobacterium frigidiphilum]PSV43849.1 cell division protein FtsL [Photobacterium indicum]